MTHVDLFSGIGGFALAAQWAGFRTVCFSEVDEYASAVLRKHWPDVPNVGDITTADFTRFRGATILTGEFPCQPFSLAGKQLGKKDDRFLWPSMLRAIQTIGPTWVIGENVAGLIAMELDRVLSDLEGIGYTALPFVIPACAVDAKHRRDRVWIVANSVSAGERGHQWESEDAENALGNSKSGGIRRGDAPGESGQSSLTGEALADAYESGLEEFSKQSKLKEQSAAKRSCQAGTCEWPVEPDVGRVAHGVSNRVDRLKALGNAIVPQVAFEILKTIAAIERG